jgi:hypothetical protein
MNGIESFGPTAATLGGGFFVGILIGYAIKKIIKMVAVILEIIKKHFETLRILSSGVWCLQSIHKYRHWIFFFLFNRQQLFSSYTIMPWA